MRGMGKPRERPSCALTGVLASHKKRPRFKSAAFVSLIDFCDQLAPAPPGFDSQPAEERLHCMMMRWFDALAPHRRVTGEMLRTKLYPSHPHHWVPMIFNLSRTIQWLRDAAMLDAGGRRRQVEEVGLTALFLAALGVWLRDESSDQAHTRDWLRRRLANSDRLMVRLWGAAGEPHAEDETPSRKPQPKKRAQRPDYP